jgi:hypothetical protein
MNNARFSAAVICFYFCFLTVISTAASSAAVLQWKEASDGIRERSLRSVAVDPGNQDIVFTSSDVAVYKSSNGGRTWDEILSLRSTGYTVNTIFIPSHHSDMIYVGAGDGLHRRCDAESGWKRIFSGLGPEENSVLSIIAGPEAPGRIVIGTEAGLFVSKDDGKNWTKGRNLPSDTAIPFIVMDGSNSHVLYAATDKGLYKSLNGGSGWKRILELSDAEDHPLSDGEEPDEDSGEDGTLRGIAVDPSDPKIIFAATSRGLRISRDTGVTWKGAGSLGLGSLDIRHILVDRDTNSALYAATGRGVFRYSPGSDVWEELYKGMISQETYYLALSKVDDTGRKTLWAATRKGIYRAEIPVLNAESVSGGTGTGSVRDNDQVMDMLSTFSHEPTIGEVREAAIQYAEVQPEKILKWRKAAAARAWLPDLKVVYGKGTDWQSSTYFYSTSSQKYTDDDITEGKDRAWSISLNWELGDLIWNSAQTSIDTRSRLVVQLRDDVLSEVTRIYFERRRLMVEMRMSPPADTADKIEKELRLQELTAGLDAMTGSFFSKRLKQGGN